MKTTPAILVLLVLLCISRPVGATDAGSLPVLEIELGNFADTPGFQAHTAAVRLKIGELEMVFAQAESIGRAGHFQIDVIGQTHTADSLTMAEQGEVLISQDFIQHYLTDQKYQLVCREGSVDDSVTAASIERQVILGMPVKDSVDSTLFHQQLWATLINDGVLSYVWEHPQAVVIGGEDHALNALHGRVLDRLETSNYSTLNEWFNLIFFNRCLRRTRSELALAKTIIALAKHGYTRGAIVMGDRHLEDFQEFLPRYGIEGTLVPAKRY